MMNYEVFKEKIMIKDLLYRVESAKDGNPSLIVEDNGKSIALHSKVNPLKEGDTAGYAPDPEKFDFLVVLGCGLGYSFLKLKEPVSRFRQVFVIDILSGIENEIRKNTHTSFLVDGENTRFFSGMELSEIEDLLSEALDFHQFRGIQVMEHLQSFRIFPEYYNGIKSLIKKTIDKKAGDRATIKAFGNLFLGNALNNLKNIRRSTPLSAAVGRFRGRKAVIVSSAPSIEDNLEKLKYYKNEVYIIAVDSVLPVLKCCGIQPDFVISIDPQARIGEHFLGHENSGAVHIFSIVSPPELVRKYRGFISFNSHPVSQVIEDMYPGIGGSIDSSTGSVAGDAFMFALLAGFDYIAMTGFDFSFSGNNIYARETAYQKRYTEYFNNRFKTSETFNAAYIFKSSGSLVVEGKYTRRSFLNYRSSLDSLIREKDFKNIFIINRRGLPLMNARSTDFDSFMKMPAVENEDKTVYLRESNFQREFFPFNMKRIRERFSDERVLDAVLSESLGSEVSAGKRKKIVRIINSIE